MHLLKGRYIITYMKAEPYYMFKRLYENGDIIEIKAWKVEQSSDKPHGFKYSLVFVRDGKRVIGYDNSEQKGDHRHYKGKEHQYRFKGIDELIEDFFNDVRRFKDEG
ncbi:MAG: DUF6516 family protein [Nitrospirae bacterium]|nr:DUF6516 family protein [Nitrospirota bacterium]MCL5978173.1 DUF6516 family protein [Nitrospirota bacterium]